MNLDHSVENISPNIGTNITFTGSGAIVLPTGSTATRPTPVAGMVRLNTDKAVLECYSGSAWASVGNSKTASTGLTASGTGQVDGYPITSDLSIFTTINGSGYSCVLPSSAQVGSEFSIFHNAGGNFNLLVYPQVGGQLDSFSVNTPYSIVPGQSITVTCVSSTNWVSNQITAKTYTSLILSSTANSLNIATGALVVSGGVGIGSDVTIGGNAKIIGNVNISGNSLNITNLSGADNGINISGPAGYNKTVSFQSSASKRFVVGIDNSSEGGSDTGSTFFISRYSDAGSFQDYPFYIPRSTGVATFKRIQSTANISAGYWSTTGCRTSSIGGVLTDTSSAASSTLTWNVANSFTGPSLAANNTGITYTNAATVYISGAPTAGTNVSITNPYALYVSGNVNFTTPLPISSGGTGQSTSTGAINALLPSQTSKSGYSLTTDGTNVSWSLISGGGSGNKGTAILDFGPPPGANTAYVAVTGQSGILSNSIVNTNLSYYSMSPAVYPDGYNWTENTSINNNGVPATASFVAIAYGGGTYSLLADDFNIYIGSNLSAMFNAGSIFSSPPADYIYAANLFIQVLTPYDNNLWISPNGYFGWTSTVATVPSSNSVTKLAANGSGTIVIGSATGGYILKCAYTGSSAPYFSTSTMSTPTSENLNGVCWNPVLNIFVAVGNAGTIIRSDSTGVTWTAASSNYTTSDALIGIKSATNGRMVAIGNSSTNYVISDDAITWTPINSKIFDSAASKPISIESADNTFVVISNDGKVSKSIDGGMTWRQVKNILPTKTKSRTFTEITNINNNLVLLGPSGFLAYSPAKNSLHNSYEHDIAPINTRVSNIVPGTGFTITGSSQMRLTGLFQVTYAWS